MLVVKLFFCLLIFHICGCTPAMKSCRDCIERRLCPGVVNIPPKEIKEKLINSMCGTDKARTTIKVCCSDFAVREGDNITLSSRQNFNKLPIIDNTDYHTNNIDNHITHNIKLYSRQNFNELPIINDTDDHENNIDNHTNIKLLPNICGKKFDYRIVGGNETAIHEFPWMALIYHKDNNEKVILDCGGSVISSRYILTAAHCVKDKRITGVRVGDFNIQKEVYCQGEYPYYVCQLKPQELRVEKTIVHKEYSKNPNMINDIALLRVKESIDFSLDNVKPICLPVWKEIRTINLSGKASIVAGWGLMEGGKRSAILRKVTIPIMPEIECANYFGRNSNPKQSSHKTFCAGETGKDSCNGDSGGPLVIFDKYKDNYRMIQYGIVSYGSQMCGYEAPGVYTDVSKYMKWILDNIEE